jgi:hypothetical protein
VRGFREGAESARVVARMFTMNYKMYKEKGMVVVFWLHPNFDVVKPRSTFVN